MAQRDGHPFAALAATEMAAKVAASFTTPHLLQSPPHSGGNGSKCGDSIQQLRTHLQLQVTVWRSWGGDYEKGERPSLAEVEAMGLEGLVWERLSDRGLCDDVDVARDVSEKIAPLVHQFGGDLNVLLLGWVEDTVNKCVIVDSSPDVSLQDQHDRLQQDTCTLLRLVTIALSNYTHPTPILTLALSDPNINNPPPSLTLIMSLGDHYPMYYLSASTSERSVVFVSITCGGSIVHVTRQ